MKKMLCLLALIVSSKLVFCQFNDKDFSFTKIDSIKGAKDILYAKSKIWVVDAFKSAKDVIQMDDKETGRIVARGIFLFPAKNLYGAVVGHDMINFKVTIDVKDNKYRMVLSDFYHEGGAYKGGGFNGGNLSREKPACGTFNIQMKRWNKIKSEAQDMALNALSDFSKGLQSNLPKDDF